MLHRQYTGASWQIACCIERFARYSKLTARVGYSDVSVFTVSAGWQGGVRAVCEKGVNFQSAPIYRSIRVLFVGFSIDTLTAPS